MFDARAFARHDESADELFYRQPRFVEHIDDVAVSDVIEIHRRHLPQNGKILDLMSSWVSHLPTDVAYANVLGLGMNEAELAANPRLDSYLVQNLNERPALPFEDASFDAATICVSIQYLTNPIPVLRDLARVVRTGGEVVITFSNRCFPTKAVAIWQAFDSRGHLELVSTYLESAGWSGIETASSLRRFGDPLYSVIALSPARLR